jgi:RsiW-degrading membrane proteinase PrsW (M82 family)
MNEKKSHHEASVWQADIWSVAALVVFVLVVYWLDNAVQPVFTGSSLLITGGALSLVPAAIWLAFFYRRDRREPEPKGMVFRVFLLGGLLAAAVGIPALDNIFQIDSWINGSALSQLLGGILVVGFTQEFLKYAAVRFTMFGSAEFDECVDGIIYATAAGLGYAAVLNIAFVVDSGGVDLGAGIVRITITSLAHASFGGVTGYFLGREKFGSKPVWWTAAGVGLAAVLNGMFFYLRNAAIAQGGISASGGQLSRWLGLILAAVLATVITGVLSRLIGGPARQSAEG